ncbi:MAG: OsmC family protein [Chloroflexi bacterium]|nr:OsmC family protein [Chloroflexota bacterium]MBU1751436.1 OsmC family protein [Chloroflexota bacterium]
MTQGYKTTVRWLGERKGFLVCGNGPALTFAAPPDAHGEYGVLTPEDAFVAAVNTCIHMMFIWACERFQIDLVSYECEAEGFKQIRLDQTEEFTQVILRPRIVVRGGDERRVQRALQAARKYSLIAESVRCSVDIEPEIVTA